MNFALPAVLFLFFIIPGLVLFSRLYRVDGVVLDFQPISEKMGHVFFWSIFVHILLIFLLDEFANITVQYSVIVAAFSGKLEPNHVGVIANSLFKFAGYLFLSILVSYFVALAIRRTVEYCNLDKKYGLLKFRSPWLYIFTDDRDAGHAGTYISALVDVKDGTYLYSGILEEYFFDKDGGLDRMVLSEVVRRKMSNDKGAVCTGESGGDERFYKIDGDYIVVRYDEIITLNVRYVKIEV